MKKITLFIATIIVFCCNSISQSATINKSYSTTNITKLILKFDYPKIVKIETWDKNEVSITANVSINDGENNDAFVIQETADKNVLRIEAKVSKVNDLPRKFFVTNKGIKYKFSSKAELEKFKRENNIYQNYCYNHGVDIEIQVTVFVPKELYTDITNTYGLIEVKNFAAPLVANSPYTGIDVTISKEEVGKLSAQTNHGEILSNIDFEIVEKENKDFYSYFSANVGNGFNYKLTSKYGKLYLRKK